MNGAVLAKVLERSSAVVSSAVEIEFFGQPRSEFSNGLRLWVRFESDLSENLLRGQNCFLPSEALAKDGLTLLLVFSHVGKNI